MSEIDSGTPCAEGSTAGRPARAHGVTTTRYKVIQPAHASADHVE
jgi:hypothetical protein